MSNSKPTEFNGLKPMPKRFRVWDKRLKGFIESPNDDEDVFDLVELSTFFTLHAETGRPHTDFEIIQSTNLFDKDGKEIFEGSIVEKVEFLRKKGRRAYVEDARCKTLIAYDDGEFLTEHYRKNKFEGALPLSQCFGVWEGYDGKTKTELKVIGHILSNPELLGER